MANSSPQELLNTAVEAARSAGGYAHAEADRRMEVAERSRYDVKLLLDRESQTMAEEVIQRAYPEHAILGEEGRRDRAAADIVWVIDPIDGTVNFSHGMPNWCSAVAAMRGDEVVAGAVYVPPLDELYTATLDGPALCNGEPIHASPIRRFDESLVCTGLSKHMDERSPALGVLRNLALRSQKVRMMGAAAVDICHVACGRAEGYFEMGIYLWDVAAAGLIARRAGAVTRVIEQLGEYHMRYLCSTPAIADDLEACYRDAVGG